MVEQVVVGIDVSKAKLDVALLPGGEQFTVSIISRIERRGMECGIDFTSNAIVNLYHASPGPAQGAVVVEWICRFRV